MSSTMPHAVIKVVAARPFNASRSRRSLFEALVEAARTHGRGKEILEDADRRPLTYGRLITASLTLGAKLKALTRPAETVGVLLPNSAGLIVTLFGLNAFGRAAALLNFTSGLRNLQSAVRTGPLDVIVTSRRFIDTAKLEETLAGLDGYERVPGRRVRIVYLEDVRTTIGMRDKAQGFLRARFTPSGPSRKHRMTPDSLAVLLFTSGTEGTPKGVALTNANLVANACQIWSHADGMLTTRDVMLNPLPMFHSFGLTAGALLGLFEGFKVVLYPSPLHYRQVPKLIASTKATFLLATDTFLQGYARAADPGDLRTIRYVVAGAEHVKDATRALWSGLVRADGTDAPVILEGYGATECAPVLACNIPATNRAGTVGALLPGIEAELQPVEGIGEGGRLRVRGPNVMAGYVDLEAPGVIAAPADGWHDTGDIVTITDGFIQIRGRAKRFAKIGGEMISLAAVETLAAAIWPDAQHVVVALPDARRGEQLILVTDKPEADKDSLAHAARSRGYPELWVPRAVLVVRTIPTLGSGKVDLPATTELVRTQRALL